MDGGRLLKSRGMWLAVLLGMAGMAFGTKFPVLREPLSGGHFIQMAEEALQSSAVLFLIPAVAVLPFGDVWMKERESGFLRIYLARKGKFVYAADRAWTQVISGCLAVGMAVLFILLIYFLLFFPLEEKIQLKLELFLPLLQRTGRSCLAAGILAGMSGIAAVHFESLYMAYGLPFTGYYLLIILHERYFKTIYVLDPQSWILGTGDWGPKGAGLWLFLLLLAVGAMAVYGGMLYGKCREV